MDATHRDLMTTAVQGLLMLSEKQFNKYMTTKDF